MPALLNPSPQCGATISVTSKAAPRRSSQTQNVAGELWGDFLAAAAFVFLASSVLLQTLRALLE
jgi:hypothetical protein